MHHLLGTTEDTVEVANGCASTSYRSPPAWCRVSRRSSPAPFLPGRSQTAHLDPQLYPLLLWKWNMEQTYIIACKLIGGGKHTDKCRLLVTVMKF